MTLAARQVLEDCKEAANDIDGKVQGSAWRRRYVVAVVLLRTVGYVLGRIACENTKYKAAIKNEWAELNKSKPDPPIFWEFIDKVRNNIVHEYIIHAEQGATVFIGQNKPTENHYTINDGYYKGYDQRDLLKEAIEWWEAYIDRIDQASP